MLMPFPDVSGYVKDIEAFRTTHSVKTGGGEARRNY
jgi:hypothetical protein